MSDAPPASGCRFDLRDWTSAVPISPPLVMGVLNVTPDSFSDGGEYFEPSAAIDRALAIIEEGAAIIDVGPESTRPGSAGVPADEQIRRALPVIEAIRSRSAKVAVSVDTTCARVAGEALNAGADMVNDTSALRDDPAMVEVVAAAGAALVLMHRRGTPADMQAGGGPHYDDITGEICGFLAERRDAAVRGGVAPARIVLDPGLGFGKRFEHNLQILRELDRFAALGPPVLLGASRKRFIGSLLGIENPRSRDAASLACAVWASLARVSIVRTHDVRATVEALRLVHAVSTASGR